MLKTVGCGLVAVFVVLIHASIGSAAGTAYPDVARIFQERCVMCHLGPNAPLGLQLDTLEHLLKGSSNGPVVLAGSPESSELIRRIRGISQPRMPMTGPPFLDEPEIALIESWVAAGLPAGPAHRTATAQKVPGVPSGSKATVTYADIAPILMARCVKCHAESGLMGAAPEGYLLVSYQAALSPRDRVRVVPGYPAASELVRRVKGWSWPRMPFDGPPYLETQEMTLVADWVKQGALNMDDLPAPYPTGARIRVQGQLIDLWQLDDYLDLTVSTATRMDKSPGIGDYVEVRGRLLEGGRIAAERIRRR